VSDETPVSRHEFDVYIAAHRAEHEAESRADERDRTALDRRLEGMNEFREAIRDQQKHFLTVERFEREHELLENRISANTDRLTEKVSDEHIVTVRQEAQQALIDKLSTNNRWLIGTLLISGISLATLISHLLHLF
jgi:monoamine oxidase